MPVTPSSGQAIQVAEGLVKAMSAASRTLRLYPETSPLPLQAVRNFHGMLSEALSEKPFITIGVTREGFTYSGEKFGQDHEGLKGFATDLYTHQVSAMIFRTGVNEREILEFLRLLALDPLLVREQGGMASLLLEQHVSNLFVDEIELHIVDEEGKQGGPTTVMVMHLVDDVSHTAVRAVEQFFVSLSSSVPQMVEWLRSVSPPTKAQAVDPAENLVEAVRQLGASIAASTELPQDQMLYFRNIAEGILALEEPLRSQVFCERIIPESATSKVFSRIVSQMSEPELAALLAGASESGLEQTERLLGALSVLGDRREQVYSLLEQMLIEKGHSPEEVSRLKEKLPGRGEEAGAPAMGEDTVEILMAVSEYSDDDLRAIESAPAACQESATTVSALRIELALLAQAENEQEYCDTLDALPELLAGLVASGQVEVAAESLDWALSHARSVLKMWPAVGEHLRVLGETAGSCEVVGQVVEFLSRRSADRDIRAAARYVSLLPDASIEHLVDALATADVMATRKRLCVVLSETGRKAIHVLGSRVTDPRWYLVRNVVSVFGMMRDPAALNYLKQTLEHEDARVRSETVRALGLIRDSSSAAWLIGRLDDPAPVVRASAARWLGRMRCPEAVSALCQIVDTRFRSDRDLVKVAVQALSHIGDASARPCLERLASRRAVFHRGAVRELKELAAQAVAALEESEERSEAEEMPS